MAGLQISFVPFGKVVCEQAFSNVPGAANFISIAGKVVE